MIDSDFENLSFKPSTISISRTWTGIASINLSNFFISASICPAKSSGTNIAYSISLGSLRKDDTPFSRNLLLLIWGFSNEWSCPIQIYNNNYWKILKVKLGDHNEWKRKRDW